jgi:protein arginine N-methyltransferase 2
MFNFLSKTLTFLSDKIYFLEGKETKEVMMSWESPIMMASAEYVTNGGSAKSILEIGFGMGISAGYIQQFKPSTHTIIEGHPEIVSKANDFAKKNEGVNILYGDWYDLVRGSELGKYDGIFFDTYYDLNDSKFKEYLPNLINKGGRVTWWNPTEDKLPPENLIIKKGVEYQRIDIKEKIPANSYHNSSVYWMPKIQF